MQTNSNPNAIGDPGFLEAAGMASIITFMKSNYYFYLRKDFNDSKSNALVSDLTINTIQKNSHEVIYY